ncbi:MAG: site-specific integrase [Segetibacter sp.]
MKATSQLLLITRRPKISGKYPLKIRVIYHRKSKDFPVGMDLTKEQFEGATAKSIKKDYKSLEIAFSALKTKANNVINEIGVFTFKKFQDSFYGRVKDASDIFSIFDLYISELNKENRIKTSESYLTVKNSFKKYNSNFGLYDITPSFLAEYHQYQIGRGVSETSIGIYVRTLRSIYNYAISLGVIKKDENYPFGKRKYIIPAGRNVKKALQKSDINKIYTYQTIPGSPEDKARDFWMLSYFCNGINFKDLSFLKNKNLDGDILRFIRQKTKNTTRGNQTTISCHLSAQAIEIIGKWRNQDKKPDAYLFTVLQPGDDPYVEVKKIAQFIKNTNKYMKRISKSLGFASFVTTYFSRHSAATILKRSGASIEVIQEALGHLNSKTTEKYLDSFDDDTKKALSTSLSNFLI